MSFGSEFVRGIVERHMGKQVCHTMQIGDRVRYGKDGRIVQITAGRFWGEMGMSNFWYWREVLPNGELAKNVEHGYGDFTDV